VLGLKRVALFGSWVKARETAFSDIDLMVLYAGSHREDAYSLVKSYIDLRGSEPHVFSEEEANNLKQAIDRMTREAIVLFPNRVRKNSNTPSLPRKRESRMT
jgi:predicted nucleotidyltransferase